MQISYLTLLKLIWEFNPEGQIQQLLGIGKGFNRLIKFATFLSNIIYFCQAQPTPKLNWAEAELALFPLDPATLTHPSSAWYSVQPICIQIRNKSLVGMSSTDKNFLAI